MRSKEETIRMLKQQVTDNAHQDGREMTFCNLRGMASRLDFSDMELYDLIDSFLEPEE